MIRDASMSSWRMVEAGRPLELVEEPLPVPAAGEALLQLRACGLCHTDVAFLYDGVRPKAALPLTLGHEIVGEVVAAGDGAEQLVGATFVVPAVLPCGSCELCRDGRGNACRNQLMPGNDLHGGFASHFLAPARFLVPVPDDIGVEIEALAIVGDAVGTAYQSVLRSNLDGGGLAVIVGLGGVGTFVAQCARARGARVVGIDVDEERLSALGEAIDLGLDARALSPGELRRAVAEVQAELGLEPWKRCIFECSGTVDGQQEAWALLTHGSTLVVVGYTRDKVEIRLSNLMAFDARVQGNWGCAPEYFPLILELIRDGKLQLEPFVEYHPMSEVNGLLRSASSRRPVLIPDFAS